MEPRTLSIVVQGPVSRRGVGCTPDVLASLRRAFPGAELVLSTWVGTDIDGLDADVIVCSDDPGIGARGSNVNRQVRSSMAGISAASRSYVLKTRTDILFGSGQVLDAWGKFRERAPLPTRFTQRILASSLFTRRPSLLAPWPFHVGDWVFLGLREDVRTLFDVPVQTPAMADPAAEPSALHRQLLRIHLGEAHRAIPEQFLMHEALRANWPTLPLRYWCDLTPQTLLATEVAFAQEFVVLDAARHWNVLLPKYAASDRLLRDATLLGHDAWRDLYARFSQRATRGNVNSQACEQGWAAMLQYTIDESPAFMRDETGGGGALRSRAMLLAALATALLGERPPKLWAQPMRAGLIPSAIPHVRAGWGLQLPETKGITTDYGHGAREADARCCVNPHERPRALMADSQAAVWIQPEDDVSTRVSDPARCILAPRFSLGRPAHEQRLARLQQISERLAPDGVALLEFPWSERPLNVVTYLRNDLVAALEVAITPCDPEEVPLGLLAPLARDASLVGLAVDDYVADGPTDQRRVWVRLRHASGRRHARVVVFGSDIAARFGVHLAATELSGWTVHIAPADLERGRVDAAGIAAGRRPSVLVVSDAWISPCVSVVVSDDPEVQLVVDVGASWASIERVARLAMVRPRLLAVASDRETLLRLHLLAPHVPSLLLEGHAFSPASITTEPARSCSDVLVDRSALSDHPHGMRVLDAVGLLQQDGIEVHDGALASAHSSEARWRLAIGASERIFVDQPAAWLRSRATTLGVTLPAVPARRLPQTLPQTLSNADVVSLDLPLLDTGGRWSDVISVWNAELQPQDIAHAVRGWILDDATRERHVRERVPAAVAPYCASDRLQAFLAHLQLQGIA